ncbi:hypothetical protein SAMN05444678_113128 [Sphingomonas sp. YR710]|nr:hypothetical protein SAMN05444678_113128 [Sphingomonas sp. YR710]
MHRHAGPAARRHARIPSMDQFRRLSSDPLPVVIVVVPLIAINALDIPKLPAEVGAGLGGPSLMEMPLVEPQYAIHLRRDPLIVSRHERRRPFAAHQFKEFSEHDVRCCFI